MTTIVHRPTPLELIWENAHYEARYPDFIGIADGDGCQCCRVLDVADIYGWGNATEAWEEYDANRWLLGLR